MIHSTLWPPNMVCIMASTEFSFGLRLYSPSISQASIVIQQTFNVQHTFSLAMESCMASVHTGHGVHLIVFFFETIAPDDSRTTLLIIFTSLSEILWGATGHGRFIVKLCSFFFQIMAPIVLTGTLFEPLYSDWTMYSKSINSYLKLHFFPPPLMEAPNLELVSLISSNKRLASQNC